MMDVDPRHDLHELIMIAGNEIRDLPRWFREAQAYLIGHAPGLDSENAVRPELRGDNSRILPVGLRDIPRLYLNESIGNTAAVTVLGQVPVLVPRRRGNITSPSAYCRYPSLASTFPVAS